jgi:hypothetical protein
MNLVLCIWMLVVVVVFLFLPPRVAQVRVSNRNEARGPEHGRLIFRVIAMPISGDLNPSAMSGRRVL